MEYMDYSDRYVIKLHFLLPPNPVYPDLIPSNERQRINVLVTNLRPEETLNLEKLNCIAGKIPALHQWMRGALIHVLPEDLPNLKIIRAPYQASAGDHPVHGAWKAFTGSGCQAYKTSNQATAYRPQIVLARKRPSMIPPAPLQVPQHPEPEQRDVMLSPDTLYSAQVLPSGEQVYEVLTPITHAGGEEVPGLWRFSSYKPDDTVYFSVVIKVTEKRQAPKNPGVRKRKAEDRGQDSDQAPSMKRQRTTVE